MRLYAAQFMASWHLAHTAAAGHIGEWGSVRGAAADDVVQHLRVQDLYKHV